MAERRMFAKSITESDAFLEMPLSTQALYLHLNMNADDDGFVSSPKRITRMINASEDDLKLLLAKRFVLGFNSGIVVIKHWKMNNYIRNDRYKETSYQDELKTLKIKENGSYTELTTDGIPDDNRLVHQMETQVRLGKDSIDKDKEERKKERKNSFDTIIENYTTNIELQNELKNHLKVRKQKKGTLTDRAIELELKTLDRLADDDETKIRIVQKSIEGGWIGFFKLKEEDKNKMTDEEEIAMLEQIEKEMEEGRDDYFGI